jgi:hypothetical protein
MFMQSKILIKPDSFWIPVDRKGTSLQGVGDAEVLSSLIGDWLAKHLEHRARATVQVEDSVIATSPS